MNKLMTTIVVLLATATLLPYSIYRVQAAAQRTRATVAHRLVRGPDHVLGGLETGDVSIVGDGFYSKPAAFFCSAIGRGFVGSGSVGSHSQITDQDVGSLLRQRQGYCLANPPACTSYERVSTLESIPQAFGPCEGQIYFLGNATTAVPGVICFPSGFSTKICRSTRFSPAC